MATNSNREEFWNECKPTPHEYLPQESVPNNEIATPTKVEGYWENVRQTLRLFAALPPQLLVVLTLELLNSFRNMGLGTVLYNYTTNEFGLSDSEAGAILGVKGLVDCVFGLIGSILVDLVGVRRTTIYALSSAIVGRTLLSFGRSTRALYTAAFLFSPCGEALLSMGLYSVALKKLTTPRTRTLVFSISYAIRNMSGAIADLLVNAMRHGPDTVVGGAVFTPTRKFVILTLLAVIASFFLAMICLEDLTVADANDPEDDVTVPDDAIDGRAMFPCVRDSGGGYKIFKTELSSAEASHEHDDATQASLSDSDSVSPNKSSMMLSPCFMIRKTFQHLLELVRLPDLWRIVIFGIVTFPVCIQWEASYINLMPYLERLYGEGAPIYAVVSINLIGCMILPPIIGVLTASFENFHVILPGILIMALSPIALLVWPTVGGACLWQVWLTLGEVFWGPRLQSWTASMAPSGKEGMFFALASMRYSLYPLVDWVLGILNDRYNPNCTDCRDQYGHFCEDAQSVVVDDDADVSGLYQCASVEEACKGMEWMDDAEMCPSTCQECPGWESSAHILWLLLLASSLVAPVLLCLLLPYFRGHTNCDNMCCVGRIFRTISAGDGAGANRSRASYKTVHLESSDLSNGHITEQADVCGSTGGLEMT